MGKRMTVGQDEQLGRSTASFDLPADPQAALAAANDAAYERAVGPRSDGGRMGMREAINSARYRDDRAQVGMAGYVEPLERELRRQRAQPEAPEQKSNDEAAFERFVGDDGVEAGEIGDDGESRPSQIERAREVLRRTGLYSDSVLAKMSRHDIKQAARKAERKALRQERQRSGREREAGQDPEQKGSQETLPSNERAPQSQVPARKFDLSKLDAHFEAFDDPSKAALKAAMKDVVSHFEAVSESGGEQRGRSAAQEDAPSDPWTEAREAIGERWPEIADDDEFEDAKAVAKTLMSSPAYRGLSGRERYEAVLEAAARAVGLEFAGEPDNRRDMRRAGRASVTRHTGMRPAASSAQPTEDQQVTMFGYLQRHRGDLAGARRAAGLA